MADHLTDKDLADIRKRAMSHVTDEHGDRDALIDEVERLRDDVAKWRREALRRGADQWLS